MKRNKRRPSPVMVAMAQNTVKEMQEKYAAFLNNPSFQNALKNYQYVAKSVNDTLATLQPAIDSQLRLRELALPIIESISAIKIPKSLILPSEISVDSAVFTSRKEFSAAEVRSFIDEAVEKTWQKASALNKTKDGHHFPYDLPEGFKWEDLTIKFKDGHCVKIIAGEFVHNADYKEMGFEDQRKVTPDQQWIILNELAKKVDNSITWEDKIANATIKKKKQLIAKKLKEYFGIKEDPFYLYKQEKAYKLKINLIPENKSIRNLPDDPLGIKEELGHFQ